MTNCVFANAAFGWKVDKHLNLKQIDVITDFLDLQDRANYDPDDLSEKEDLKLQELESQYETIKLSMLDRFELQPAQALSLFGVTDAWEGSETSDNIVLGIGFPAIVQFTLDNPAIVKHMLDAGAEWHNWVTGEG